MNYKLNVIAVVTLLSASSLTASVSSSLAVGPLSPPRVEATNPCELTIPVPKPAPLAPKNLRIIGGLIEEAWDLISGPYVNEGEENEFDSSTPSTSAYFDLLSARPDCYVAHAFRSQAEIDAIPRGGGNDGPESIRYPIYDPANDAMLQRTMKGGNAIQKQPFLGIKQTSMLLTYDFKIGPGAKYLGADYLQQYKAYRIDQGSNAGLWLSTKLKFGPIAQNAQGTRIAVLLTTGGLFMGPGVTNKNSEILEPKTGNFWPIVDTWTRYWCFVEGKLGGGPQDPTKPVGVSSEIVYVTIWAADETTEPVMLYNRLPMYSPVQDIRQFRFEFNTSETDRVNPVAEFWHRNMVVLTGLTLADVKGLLQKPVK